jgi:hypothetical protein
MALSHFLVYDLPAGSSSLQSLQQPLSYSVHIVGVLCVVFESLDLVSSTVGNVEVLKPVVLLDFCFVDVEWVANS